MKYKNKTNSNEKKDEKLEQSILMNLKRKEKYIEQISMVDEVPCFSWIDLNPTELCNRRCIFCPRSNPTFYPNQDLNISLKLAEKISDELKSLNYKGCLMLCGYGEPLMHREIVDLVSIFGKDIHTEIVTNGDKLTKNLINKLYEAGLDMILVSLYDGPNQIEYFNKVFYDAGISKDKFILRNRWYSMEEDFGVKLTNRAGMVASGNQKSVNINRPCFYTHYSLQIDWNGDAMLCAQDFNKKIKIGNVYAQSLMEIWKSKNLEKYRKVLGKSYRSHYPCKFCNVDGTLHGKKHAEIWNKIYEEKNETGRVRSSLKEQNKRN